jgi:hypothetical protein
MYCLFFISSQTSGPILPNFWQVDPKLVAEHKKLDFFVKTW